VPVGRKRSVVCEQLYTHSSSTKFFFKYIRLSSMYNNLWGLYTDPRIFQFSLRHKIMLLAERAPICRAKDCSFYPHITYFFVIETFIKPRGLDMS
jgi:hypothetical protein